MNTKKEYLLKLCRSFSQSLNYIIQQSNAHYGKHYLPLVTDPPPPPLKGQLLPLALSLLAGPRPTRP